MPSDPASFWSCANGIWSPGAALTYKRTWSSPVLLTCLYLCTPLPRPLPRQRKPRHNISHASQSDWKFVVPSTLTPLFRPPPSLSLLLIHHSFTLDPVLRDTDTRASPSTLGHSFVTSPSGHFSRRLWYPTTLRPGGRDCCLPGHSARFRHITHTHTHLYIYLCHPGVRCCPSLLTQTTTVTPPSTSSPAADPLQTSPSLLQWHSALAPTALRLPASSRHKPATSHRPWRLPGTALTEHRILRCATY